MIAASVLNEAPKGQPSYLRHVCTQYMIITVTNLSIVWICRIVGRTATSGFFPSQELTRRVTLDPMTILCSGWSRFLIATVYDRATCRSTGPRLVPASMLQLPSNHLIHKSAIIREIICQQ